MNPIAHANGQHVIPKAPTEEQQFAREADVQRWLSRLQGSPVPPQLHDGLARYLGAGIHPGSFLTALLESRVSAAAQRADPICLAAFGDIVLWLYAFAPAKAWGSEEVVQSWRASFRSQS